MAAALGTPGSKTAARSRVSGHVVHAAGEPHTGAQEGWRQIAAHTGPFVKRLAPLWFDEMKHRAVGVLAAGWGRSSCLSETPGFFGVDPRIKVVGRVDRGDPVIVRR